jgi:hypothetical protein
VIGYENPTNGYDIIGDIHGEAGALERLLGKLGYELKDGCWQHCSRQVIFLGDFIDQGLEQKRVLEVVMPMVQEDHALAVMGNHEFNALAFHTPDGEGGWLRSHTEKNIGQHQAFLNEYQDPEELESVLHFFWSLPLWIELEGLRVIHACWDEQQLQMLETKHAGQRLTPELLRKANTKDCWEYDAIETLLKGRELRLPEGHEGFTDKYNIRRFDVRVAWWDSNATTYREAFMGPEEARKSIPAHLTNGDHLVSYEPKERPLFLGHYWLNGLPRPLTPNIACTDYSVAREGGKLVAYQWAGERELLDKNFISVPARL